MTSDINPTTKDRYQIERIVSYDSGETWVDNWIRNEIGTFSSGAAASIAGDSLDIFLVGKMKYLYFFLSLLVIASATPAQFSSDATSPMVVCNATNGQGKSDERLHYHNWWLFCFLARPQSGRCLEWPRVWAATRSGRQHVVGEPGQANRGYQQCVGPCRRALAAGISAELCIKKPGLNHVHVFGQQWP